MELPSQYIRQMHALLGKDYPAYRDSLSWRPQKGLRINENKISVGDFCALWQKLNLPDLESIPWIHNGFFLPEGFDAGRTALCQAGLYYIQEPAAMTPAEYLPVEPGDYVLDLCAAPGGKATELLAKLKKTGLLLANDISPSRAKVLRKNLEAAGAVNAFVTAESPENLAAHFPHFFDKILIDAPCSGEGMFRTQPQMIRHWEEEGPDFYAPIQKEILAHAYDLLAPGGMILYSTCTFSKAEDEDQVLAFLADHGDLEAVPIPDQAGFSRLTDDKGESLPFVRLYPHKIRGEGQFAALIKKEGNLPSRIEKQAVNWQKGEEVYLLPEGKLPVPGLHYLMTGLHVGTQKRQSFVYSQAYAMTADPKASGDVLYLSYQDERVIKYLKGETLELKDEERINLPKTKNKNKDKGQKQPDTLVCVEGYPLGYGKRNGTLLKNKRSPGWRLL